jgi:hypothetical protein
MSKRRPSRTTSQRSRSVILTAAATATAGGSQACPRVGHQEQPHRGAGQLFSHNSRATAGGSQACLGGGHQDQPHRGAGQLFSQTA